MTDTVADTTTDTTTNTTTIGVTNAAMKKNNDAPTKS